MAPLALALQGWRVLAERDGQHLAVAGAAGERFDAVTVVAQLFDDRRVMVE